MKTTRAPIVAVISLVIFLLFGGTGLAQMSIEGVRAVDVTPSSFSVVWRSTSPGNPEIRVFLDQQETIEITTKVAVTAFPFIAGDPTIVDEYFSQRRLEAERVEHWMKESEHVSPVGYVGECVPAERVGDSRASGARLAACFDELHHRAGERRSRNAVKHDAIDDGTGRSRRGDRRLRRDSRRDQHDEQHGQAPHAGLPG